MSSEGGQEQQHDIGDKGILSNLLFAPGIGVALFFLYCVIRPLFKGVYSSNLHSPDRPRLKLEDGRFSWMRSTWHTTDSQLLAMVGLEAYVFIQALKLMAGIVVVIVPALIILLPVYAFSGNEGPVDDDDDIIPNVGYFFKLSISNAGKNFLWFPIVISYLVALIVLYMVHLYYRNYSQLRQAYLKNPSALSGALTLQKFVSITGSLEDARKMINAKTRAVLLTGVSTRYDKPRLQRLLEEMGLGPVASISFVNDRSDLVKLMKKRNDTLLKLETAYQKLFKTIVNKGLVNELKDLKAIHHHVKESVEDPTTVQEKLELMEELSNPDFCKTYRPMHAPDKNDPTTQVDSINFYFRELLELESDFEALLLRNGDQSDFFDSDSPLQRTSVRAHIDRTTLVSFKKFTWIGHNLKDFKLTMWGTSQSVVVIFKEPRSAAAVAQSVMSRTPFSMRSQMSPGPDDILWDNLYMPSADRSLRQIIGDLMYFLLILLFANVTAALTTVTDLEKLAEKFPSLERLLNMSPQFRSLLAGVMAPLAYNIALALVPMILRGFASFQGKVAKSEIQNSVLRKLSWFLFLQSFVVVMLATSVINLVSFVTKRNWDPLLQAFRESLVSKGGFFFNFIVQKTFLSTVVLLLKPDVLFLALVKRIGALNWTPRQYAKNAAPDYVLYGEGYAQYLTFQFQIIFAFVMIAPVFLVPALLYFTFMYFVFRHQFLYNTVTVHESGGMFWGRVVNQVIFGLILNQIFTSLHLSLRGELLKSLLMIPLIVFTISSMFFFKNTFASKAMHRPLCNEDEQIVDEVIKELIMHQDELVKPHSPLMNDALPEGKEGDLTDVSALVQYPVRVFGPKGQWREEMAQSLEEFDLEASVNPFKNPVLFRRLPTVIMSPIFLRIVKYLKDTPSTIK